MRSQRGRQVERRHGGTSPGAVAHLLAHLAPALDGSGPAVHVTDPAAPASTPPPLHVPDGVAVVVATSGSTTGAGHLVALDGEALTASARATEARLGGPGQWIACLPTHHIAGLQVLVRSLVAGTEPVVLDAAQGFRTPDLAAAAGRMRPGLPGYLSLVPTQLARVLEDDAAVTAVRGLTAVLVGGARTPAALLERARAAGLPIVTTYGMTETGGGCVYDGAPLDGVEVAVDADSRIWLTGPVLARGYLDDRAADDATFREHAGRRWLRTADRGRLDDGTLSVLGRLDDVVVTGGLNVSTAAVERALGELPGVGDVVVVGVPDERWGALVTAVVTEPLDLATVREHVAAHLGRHHAPRALVQLPGLPLRGPGKIDRLAAARLAGEHLAQRHPGSEALD